MSAINTKIIDFVNSKDIREYWQHIGYEPSALEAAWIVWQSKNHTVEEKHAVWKEIIETREDCSIPIVGYAIPQPPLHEFLNKYIEIENELISSFYKADDNAVYSYRMYFDDAYDGEWYNVSSLFKSFDEAYAHLLDDGEEPFPKFVEFVKTYIGGEGKRIFVRFNPQKEIVRVDEENYIENEKDFDIYQFGFQEMSPKFPIPFKKGEILKRVSGLYTRPSYSFDTYVYDSTISEFGYTVIKGYGIDADGNIHYESIHWYMDLERIALPLGKKDNLLTPISKYLSGEIDLALLLGAHRYILSKYELGVMNLHYLNYTKEEKILAGIDYET